jgi:hypothetical protein
LDQKCGLPESSRLVRIIDKGYNKSRHAPTKFSHINALNESHGKIHIV